MPERHSMKQAATPIRKPCECGCGKMARARFVHGHNGRGVKHSPEWAAKQAEGIKRAYGEGKMAHSKNPSAELIEKRAKPLRGRKRPEHVGKAVAAGVRKAWADGRYETPAVMAHRKRYLRRTGASPEKLEAMRAMRDMEKLKADNSVKLKKQMERWKAFGVLDDVRRKAGNARGMLDHLAAKAWIIRDPAGNIYKFSNLREWARKNAHRFEDDRPAARNPFWLRVSGGIGDLLSAGGRVCSYKGWTAVSKMELKAGGMDLLGRDYFQKNAETFNNNEDRALMPC